MEDDGEICASMILNHEQAEEYSSIDWKYPGMGETVLVIAEYSEAYHSRGTGTGNSAGLHIIAFDFS